MVIIIAQFLFYCKIDFTTKLFNPRNVYLNILHEFYNLQSNVIYSSRSKILMFVSSFFFTI